MRVAVLTTPRTTRLYRDDPNSKVQMKATEDAVVSALQALGHDVLVLPAGPDLLVRLEEEGPDVVFNIASGYHTKKQQANLVAMLELSDVPFTGSGSRAHTVGLFKHLAKLCFAAYGVPTPRFKVFNGAGDLEDPEFFKGMRPPVIVKPAAEGSSLGISSDSVTEDPAQARKIAEHLLDAFRPPVLIEEYVGGREFTVALLGYPEPSVLPIQEILLGQEGTYTYGVKVRDDVPVQCPAHIPWRLKGEIERVSLAAFAAIGCRDFARVDVRLSGDGRPFVLEINTLPGLMPGYSEITRIAEKAGMTYTDLVDAILQGAIFRKEESQNRQALS